jgi:thiol:disulfide interchange protein DsbA
MLKSVHAAFLVAALWLLSGPAVAEIVAGRDYTVLDPPQRTLSPGKIEVLEFFSYGCPRCNDFYPHLRTWTQKLPRDVAFRRVATGFGHAPWTNLAKTYYALEATGDIEALDGALFHAIYKEHAPLFDQKSITGWVGDHGVNPQKFATAFASFGVNTQLSQAEQMVEAYKIERLPALVVNGKYVVNGANFEELLRHATELIVRERASTRTLEAGPGTP